MDDHFKFRKHIFACCVHVALFIRCFWFLFWMCRPSCCIQNEVWFVVIGDLCMLAWFENEFGLHMHNCSGFLTQFADCSVSLIVHHVASQKSIQGVKVCRFHQHAFAVTSNNWQVIIFIDNVPNSSVMQSVNAVSGSWWRVANTALDARPLWRRCAKVSPNLSWLQRIAPPFVRVRLSITQCLQRLVFIIYMVTTSLALLVVSSTGSGACPSLILVILTSSVLCLVVKLRGVVEPEGVCGAIMGL